MASNYLFIIYTCQKNIEQANTIYHYLVSKNFQQYCQIYITYGNTAKFTPTDILTDDKLDAGRQNYILEDHYIILNTPDDYYSLNKKTQALVQVILKEFPTVKGLFKCDDDVIPNISHLAELITSSRLSGINYCGNKVIVSSEREYNFNNNPSYPTTFPIVRYCGGPLYYLSSHALEVFKDVKKIKWFLAEDVMVGYNLNHAGIEPSPNVEELYSNYATNLNRISFHNYKHETKYLDIIKVPNLTIQKSASQSTIIPLGILCPQINGGLGNQLFKLGAAISLSREYNRELVISKQHFIPNSHQSAEKTMKTLEKLFCKDEYKLRIIDSNIPGGYYVYRAGGNESFQYVDLSSRIPQEIIQGCDNLMLDGYFINPRYLPPDYPSLISITPTRTTQELLDEYGNLDQTYFIHVRLGDYVGHELYRIPLESYYPDCIARIKYSNPSANFIVCTNEYSRNLERYLEGIRRITDFKVQNRKDDELDTLYVMSQCRGGICSNSTLSWLGCYFQSARIKATTSLEVQSVREHIYMPYPWVNRTWHGFTDENTCDIYPAWASVYDTQTSKFRDAN